MTDMVPIYYVEDGNAAIGGCCLADYQRAGGEPPQRSRVPAGTRDCDYCHEPIGAPNGGRG